MKDRDVGPRQNRDLGHSLNMTGVTVDVGTRLNEE
jgi:hypothetical protein